jgi:hypothetical protein
MKGKRYENTALPNTAYGLEFLEYFQLEYKRRAYQIHR